MAFLAACVEHALKKRYVEHIIIHYSVRATSQKKNPILNSSFSFQVM